VRGNPTLNKNDHLSDATKPCAATNTAPAETPCPLIPNPSPQGEGGEKGTPPRPTLSEVEGLRRDQESIQWIDSPGAGLER